MVLSTISVSSLLILLFFFCLSDLFFLLLLLFVWEFVLSFLLDLLSVSLLLVCAACCVSNVGLDDSDVPFSCDFAENQIGFIYYTLHLYKVQTKATEPRVSMCILFV